MKSGHSLVKAFKGKRGLITGGLGFIGSNLARTLVKLGAGVTILDRGVSSGGTAARLVNENSAQSARTADRIAGLLLL